MKSKLPLLTILLLPLFINAQNVGIGIANPTNKLTVGGNLLITQAVTSTNTPPTPSQTKTMVNGGSTDYFNIPDSTGRFYDPGGPSGNYVANGSASVGIIGYAGNSGFQVTIESIDLGTGDSLIISDGGGNTFMAVGNVYNTTGTYTFSSPGNILFFQFKSNGDASVGAGFSILWKSLAAITQPAVTNFTAKALFFDANKGSIRSGSISNDPIGINSVAMGEDAIATGEGATAFGRGQAKANYSVAMGLNPYASGAGSTAIGFATAASGQYALATGAHTNATGQYASAMGNSSVATGSSSIAMGDSAIATGNFATSIGNKTSARAFSSIAIGRFNDSISSSNQTTWFNNDPLLILGNGTANDSRSNALVITKAGNMGIGFNVPLQKLEVNGVTRTLGLRVDGANIGTTFKQLQGNSVVVGTGNAGVNAFGLAFTYAFANPPKMTCTAHSVVNTNDMYVVTVRNVTTTGFVAMVYRIDPPNAGTGWGQALQLDWMAWEQ